MPAVLYRAAWVLPVATPPIRGGELLVGEDGIIAAVAPAGALEVGSDTRVEELGEAMLLPGLVNVHAHPELAMFRGTLEDLPFREWILRLVGARRGALGPEDARAAAAWTMVESLAAGITTIAATETSGEAAEAMRDAGLRGIVYQEAFGPDPRQVDASVAELRAALDRLAPSRGDRVAIGVSPHAPYTVSDALYRAVTALAREESLPVALHIAESRAERELVTRGEGDFAAGLRARGIHTPPRGRTPIAMLRSLGVLEARPLLIHCVDLDESDVETIAASGSAVAHCPVANAKLGHGAAPVLALRKAGVTVGLGTDSVGSNNRLDLLEEARVGALLQRANARVHDALGPGDLLRLCTVDGARALGLDDRIGTLEPGKEADLCAVAVDRPHAIPLSDPLAALFHSLRGSDVVLAAVRGRVLYRDGRFATIDVGKAREGIERSARRLKGEG